LLIETKFQTFVNISKLSRWNMRCLQNLLSKDHFKNHLTITAR